MVGRYFNKNRKTYVINDKEDNKETCVKEVEQVVNNELLPLETITIFTTKTCPNCKMSKMLLDKAGIVYDIVDCEEDKDLARKFKISKVPTLFVPTNEGYKTFTNASEIKAFIEANK